jgi:hypothetical protein
MNLLRHVASTLVLAALTSGGTTDPSRSEG